MNSAKDTLSGGLPHSEIPGSTIARISPGLFAACHVLHRLSVPRHPPDVLNSRLSATPNGKDHPDIRTPISELRTDRCDKLSSQKTLRDPTDNPCGTHASQAARGFPLRSHNSLLYDCPSAKFPGLPLRGCTRHVRVLLAAFGVVTPGAGAFGAMGRGRLAMKAALSLSRFAAQTAVGWRFAQQSAVVEVIGLEPTTPCLQSRCSPS